MVSVYTSIDKHHEFGSNLVVRTVFIFLLYERDDIFSPDFPSSVALFLFGHDYSHNDEALATI